MPILLPIIVTVTNELSGDHKDYTKLCNSSNYVFSTGTNAYEVQEPCQFT